MLKSCAWALPGLLALAACGGGAPAFNPTPSAASSEVVQASPAAARINGPDAAAPVASPAKATPAQPVAPIGYDLRLYDENGQAAPSFELAPVEGRGYPTVRVHVVLRGPRVISPVANVQAYCATLSRCEYLPPRNGDRAMKYTVSISDDSIARLSPTKDLIAVTVRQAKLHKPSIVTVTLTVEGHPPVTRQIKYLQSVS